MQVLAKANAKAEDLSRYFTGKPCRRGHIAERYVANSVCVDCNGTAYIVQRREWREANADKSCAYSKKWRAANRDKVAEGHRRWRAANPEAVQRRNTDYEARKDKKFEWRQRNAVAWTARTRAWQIANPDKHAAISARRRAAKLMATPAWSERDEIAAVYTRAASLSRGTGIPHEVDHIVPIKGRTASGLHVIANLQILTAAENARKSNRLEA